MPTGIGPTRVIAIPAGSSDDETLGRAFKAYGYPYVTFVVKGTGTISGGVVTFEEADWAPTEQDYTGTWSAITTVNASDVTGGQQKFVHVTPTASACVRPRISTAISGGGSIEVVTLGQGAS